MARSPPTETPVVPFIRDLLEDLSLYRYRPRRLFRWDSSEPLRSRLARVRRLHAASRSVADPDHLPIRLATAVESAFSVVGLTTRTANPELVRAVTSLVIDLAHDNDLPVTFPDVAPDPRLSLGEEASLTERLVDIERRLRCDDRLVERTLAAMAVVLATLTRDHLPRALVASTAAAGAGELTAPLMAVMREPRAFVTHLLTSILSAQSQDDDDATEFSLRATRLQLLENLVDASNLSVDDALKHPNRIVAPHDSSLSGVALAEAYLRNTPFLALLNVPLPFTIPRETRFEHCHILGAPGSGKTQLIQSLMLQDFDDPDRPAVIAIDSQRDMIKTLSRLDRFNPATDDRLLIVDPSDTEWPLKLNMFDIVRDRFGTMSEGQREQMLAGILELYDYMFGALLDAELTQRQSVVFRSIARLLLEVPGATIQHLLDLLNPKHYDRFAPFTRKLPRLHREFFEDEFSAKAFTATKQQIRTRIRGLLDIPAFERMFSHPKNAIDMGAAMDAGKVVLISTAKDTLKAEASAMFGRTMIALIMQATLERAVTDQRNRRPVLVYIDEAAEYFDRNIDTLLTQARKYKVGITLAHQNLGQLERKPGLRASITGIPAIRFAAGLSEADARALDADMRTSSELLLGLRKRDRTSSEFACFVRNLTSEAVTLTLPLGRVEQEPTMSDADHAWLMTRIRSEVAAPLAEVKEIIERDSQGATGPQTGSDDVPTADSYDEG